MMRLVLVDDHKVVLLGLRSLLDAEPDIQVVGEASTASEALQAVADLQPHLVLLDLRLPDESGLVVCRRIRERWPECQVLILTSYRDDELVMEAVQSGAAGYVLKQLDTVELLSAIRAVGRGDAVLDAGVTRRILDRLRAAEEITESNAFSDLSPREMEILALVAEGRTNAEIADVVVLSVKTVSHHVSTILSKLGVSNRIEAATFAVRHHIDRHLPERPADL